jgi:hypothetical protein
MRPVDLGQDTHDDEAYVVQEHVVLDAILSGKPYLRLIRRMTVKEFLQTGSRLPLSANCKRCATNAMARALEASERRS